MADNYFRNVSFNYDVENAVPNPLLQKCIVEFFRSNKQSNKKFGEKDTEYAGEFGFDRFEKDICPSSTIQGEGAYIIPGGIVPKEEVIRGLRKYACPFMSIWPPGVEGNTDSAKSIVTVYVKAKPVKDGPDTGESEILFRSSNKAAILINEAEETKIKLNLGAADASPLTIRCLKPFGDENAPSTNFIESAVWINAYIYDTLSEEEALVGRLVIIPNVFMYQTSLIPVIVRMYDVKNKGRDNEYKNFLNNYPQDIEDFCNNTLPDFINNHAFNQALIHFQYAPENLKTLEIDRAGFTQNMKNICVPPDLLGTMSERIDFVNEIENLYKKEVEGEGPGNRILRAKEISKVDEKLQKYIEQFGKEFKYDEEKGVRVNHANKVAGKAATHEKTVKALEEYNKAVKRYDELLGEPVSTVGLNKTHKIHLFFFADIEKTSSTHPTPSNSNSNAFVPAFSPTGDGTAYILSSCMREPLAKELVTHELGHALGLEHTFNIDNSIDKEEYIDSENRNKAYLNKILKELRREIGNKEKEKKDIETPKFSKDLEGKYVGIKQLVDRSSRFKHDKGDFEWFRESVSNTISLEDSSFIENGTIDQEKINNLNNEIEEINIEIASIEAEINRLGRNTGDINLNKNLRRSYSLENFMDYQFNYSGTINSDFMYKMFNYRQWREMQGVYPYINKKIQKINDPE